jgi:prolyl-tRNA editing enzyme YbaK/EbsC (Cys-tRNA(Pro) deacylase)
MDGLTPDDVRQALAPHGIAVQELTADTSTAVLAAEALGTSVGSIVKSLLFLADEPVLVLAAGDRSVDRARLAIDLGVDAVRLAKPAQVLEITGYAVGGVPPLAHRTPLHTLMDRALFGYDVVYAAAGSPRAIFAVAPHALWALLGATITDATIA